MSYNQVIFAQQKNNEKKAKIKEMKKEVKQYYQENILPLLNEQRKKLDLALSNEDKQAIVEIRKNLADKTLKHEQKKEFKKKIKDIAQKNQTIIQENFAAISQKQETWKNSLNNIKNKYIEQKNPTTENHHRKFKFHHNKRMALALMPAGALQTNIRYLLFDYTQQNSIEKEKEKAELKALNIFPNPIKNISNITFELKAPAVVNIQLLNQKNEVVKNLVKEENRKAGEQQFQFDLSDVEKGIYFYRIEINKQTKVKRIVKD
jgi:hypothetical protein